MINNFLKTKENLNLKISHKSEEIKNTVLDILIVFKNININNSKEYRLDF